MHSSVPILFLIFNRPDKTARVFEAIRHAQPKRLYIGADGPRRSVNERNALCEQSRRAATSTSALAAEGHQMLVVAVFTTHPKKTVLQSATVKILVELSYNMAR